MSTFAPGYSLLDIVLAVLVGFVLGRITAMRSDPSRARAKQADARAAAHGARENAERLPAETRQSIEALLLQDRYIEAVRDVRLALNLGLKEAKDTVDVINRTMSRGGARAP